MKILSPAKLNLGLRIFSRLPNGFHRLESLVVPLSFSDEIHIEEIASGEETSRVCLRVELSPELLQHLKFQGQEYCERTVAKLRSEENIVFRAAVAVLESFPEISSGLSIRLKKNVPLEAGLGGGSSNAATVLRALQEMFSLEPEAKLLNIAAALGSDVPALFYRRVCYVSGRGEIVKPRRESDRESAQEAFSRFRLLLIKPPWGCETGRMYSELSQLRQAAGVAVSESDLVDNSPILQGMRIGLTRDGNYLAFAQMPLTLSYREGNGEGLSGRAYQPPEVSRGAEQRNSEVAPGESFSFGQGLELPFLGNDFETVYYRFYPPMTEVKDRLLEGGAKRVFLAGSGSTLVGLFVEGDLQFPISIGESESTLAEKLGLAGKGYFLRWAEFLP